MKPPSELCQVLEWDSHFFERRIGRINGQHLDAQSLQTIFSWSKQNRIECLYFLAASDDQETIRLAEDHQFRMVEVRLFFERWLQDWNPETRRREVSGFHIRHSQEGDLASLQDIAAVSFVNTRFHYDPCFSQEKRQAFYALWVKQSCGGGTDLALVAEIDGQAVGFITGNIDQEDPTKGTYDLAGVGQRARRMGVGNELVRSSMDWFVLHGVKYLSFPTQGRNIPTQRLFQKNGFIAKDCQIYYHKWFIDC